MLATVILQQSFFFSLFYNYFRNTENFEGLCGAVVGVPISHAELSSSNPIGNILRQKSVCVGLWVVKFPSQEFLVKLKPVQEKCIKESNVDRDVVQKFNTGEMIDDSNLKCYMKCVFLTFEVLNPDTGFIYYHKILDLLPDNMKSIAFSIGHNCVHYQGEGNSDLCQLSYDLHRCWQKSDPKHYFLM